MVSNCTWHESECLDQWPLFHSLNTQVTSHHGALAHTGVEYVSGDQRFLVPQASVLMSLVQRNLSQSLWFPEHRPPNIDVSHLFFPFITFLPFAMLDLSTGLLLGFFMRLESPTWVDIKLFYSPKYTQDPGTACTCSFYWVSEWNEWVNEWEADERILLDSGSAFTRSAGLLWTLWDLHKVEPPSIPSALSQTHQFFVKILPDPPDTSEASTQTTCPYLWILSSCYHGLTSYSPPMLGSKN